MITLQDASAGLPALAAAVLTPIIGWVSTKAYDGIKLIIPAYDKLPTLVHQVAAPLFGFASGWLTASFGVAAFTDLHGISGQWVAGLFNALLMAGIKRFEKSRV